MASTGWSYRYRLLIKPSPLPLLCLSDNLKSTITSCFHFKPLTFYARLAAQISQKTLVLQHSTEIWDTMRKSTVQTRLQLWKIDLYRTFMVQPLIWKIFSNPFILLRLTPTIVNWSKQPVLPALSSLLDEVRASNTQHAKHNAVFQELSSRLDKLQIVR